MYACFNSSGLQSGLMVLKVAGTARPRFFFPFGTLYWMHLAKCLLITGTFWYGPSCVSSRTRSGKRDMKSLASAFVNTLLGTWEDLVVEKLKEEHYTAYFPRN